MQRPVIALLLLVIPAVAGAHSVNVELRGPGTAEVVFRYADGSAMRDAEYRVFAPGNGPFPVATGETDPTGQVPLHATTDGRWRIEVEDRIGHASQARIDVTRGLVAVPGQTVPDWFVAISVMLNTLLAIPLLVRYRQYFPLRRNTST